MGRSIDRTHLCHRQRSLFGKSVVIEVQDTELTIVPHCWSQRHHARIAETILGHVDFFQTAYELGSNTGF